MIKVDVARTMDGPEPRTLIAIAIPDSHLGATQFSNMIAGIVAHKLAVHSAARLLRLIADMIDVQERHSAS